jgi:type III secretion system FlhB-like substrate exporter
MEDYNQHFFEKYIKICNVITSCVNKNHITVARQMIDNLTVMSLGTKIPYEFYISYINNLKNILTKKTDEITKDDFEQP